MNVSFIPFAEGEATLGWLELTRALEDGHRLPRAQIGDTFLKRGADTLLNRAAWIDGMGVAVKSATLFPGNPHDGLPSINGGVCLFSDSSGVLEAIIDFHLVTKWKTAGDSLLGALRLARPDSRRILVIGAGTVARSLLEAYGAGFPGAEFTIWNRTLDHARGLAAAFPGTQVAEDLESAVRSADIVTSATMATEPIIRGAWLRAGQHLDLIGAFCRDMREADDEALRRSRIFVDSRETTMGYIGEILGPLAAGVISKSDVLGDYYDMTDGGFRRETDGEITLFKNGGGAHLDLMTGHYILKNWRERRLELSEGQSAP